MIELANALEEPALRVDALQHLVSYYLATEYLKADLPLQEALRLAIELGDNKRKGGLLQQLGEFHRLQYAHPRSVEALSEALGIFEEEGLEVEVTRTLVALVRAHLGTGRMDESRRVAQRAIEMAKQVGDPQVEADARRQSVLILVESGECQEALDEADAALHLARQIGDQELEMWILNILGFAYQGLDRLEEAEATYLQLTDQAARVGHDLGWLFGTMNLVEMLESLGRYQDGLDWLTEELPGIEERGESHNLSYVHYGLGYRFLRWLGVYEEALDHVETAIGLTEEGEWQPPRVMYRNAQATLLSLLGRHNDAIATVTEAKRIADEHQMTVTYPYLYATQAKAYLARNEEGDIDRARRHAMELLEASDERTMRGEHQAALVFLARIHLAEGRTEEALMCTQNAVDLLEGNASATRHVSPEEVLYVHAGALQAAGRTEEAVQAMSQAAAVVEQHAEAIRDEELRTSYLNRVEVSRAILEAREPN
jgi:tetratricopeptide (TPR) repeat protein